MWFQHDDATCHTARVTMQLLRGEFGERFILRSEPVNWPSRSCDLTSLDYFCEAILKLMPIQTSQLQLTHWKTTLKH